MPARAPSDAGEPCQISRWPIATFSLSAANALATESHATTRIANAAIAPIIGSSLIGSLLLSLSRFARTRSPALGCGRVQPAVRIDDHVIVAQRLLGGDQAVEHVVEDAPGIARAR